MSSKKGVRTLGLSHFSRSKNGITRRLSKFSRNENVTVPFSFMRQHGLLAFITAAILLLSSTITEAASYYWNVSSGDWSDTDPCPWNLGTEPTSSDDAYIQNGGTATITQTGEQCTYLCLGASGTGNSGTIEMTGGNLAVSSCAYIGNSGTGTFTQSSGMNSISSILYIGYNYGSRGTYNLSGLAQLTAGTEYIGYSYIGYSSYMGTFTQTDGTNTATYIKIGTKGVYTFTGGTLNITGGFENQGVWDLSNSSAVINMSSSIVNLVGSTLATTGNATLNLDTHSLLIVPNGHDPAEYFAHINNAGSIVHQAGSALDISSTYIIYGTGSINDHVNCQGILTATSGYSINLNGGLNISGMGSVNLGSGTLYVNDASSGMDSGSLTTNPQYIGSTGTGTFTQIGGTNTISSSFYLGYNAGSSGTYKLSGGLNSISSLLCIGYYSGTRGTYNLSGMGQLSARSEYIGNAGNNAGIGLFTQTGGTNTATYIKVGAKGTYSFAAGTLNITGGFENQGVCDLSNSSATINAVASIIDLSSANLANTKNVSLSLDANSLLIVPAGFDPVISFKSCINNGILHQLGSALDISSAYIIYGINTITDHVNCQGMLSATTGYAINLNGGLTVSGTGSVNLRSGTLYVNDLSSGMDGGSLNTGTLNVKGTFTQSGGINIITSAPNNLLVGGVGNGTYNLSGTGVLVTNNECLGDITTGIFNHTGGTNSITNDLDIILGTYNLSGMGQLSASIEYIGDSHTGTFMQTGGTNSISTGLNLSSILNSSGTYNLNGGTLILKSISQGSGTAVFNFGGGTLQASGAFTTSLPMTLTGDSGNANLDTAGYAVTLSGVLSGTGGLNKLGSGMLTLNALNTYSGDTTVSDGTLAIAGGIDPGGTSLIDVQSGTAALKTVNVNKTNLNINTAALATFEVVNGAHTVGAIAGSGTTQVDAGANLTAQSINQGTLTIASGATVTIQAIPGGPLALSDNLQPVPEPSTLVLIGMGSIGLLAYTRRWSCVRLPKSELSGKGKLPVNGSLPGRGGRPGLCPLSCI